MSSNLAIKLRSGTQQAHTSAENVAFMKCFLKGVVDRDCNAQVLKQLVLRVQRTRSSIKEPYRPSCD